MNALHSRALRNLQQACEDKHEQDIICSIPSSDPEDILHQLIQHNLASFATSKNIPLTNVEFLIHEERPIDTLNNISDIIWITLGPRRHPRRHPRIMESHQKFGVYFSRLKEEVTKEDLFLALRKIGSVVNCQVDHFPLSSCSISCGYAYFSNLKEREKVLEKSSMGVLKIKGEAVKCVPLKGSWDENENDKGYGAPQPPLSLLA